MSFLNVFFKILAIIIILLPTKVKSVDIFKGIKKLSLNENYFVALNTGLYLYNSNFLNRALITSFDSSVYKNNNDIIIIKELVYDNYYFIFCMVNKYLFLFNEKYNTTNSFFIDENDIIPTNYYDLLPYKISNNIIRFFISLNKDDSYIFWNYYKISLETSKMEKLNTIYSDNHVINNLVRCLIINSKSKIYCFYVEQINNINYLQSISETIKDNILQPNEKYQNLTSSDKELNS